MGERLKKRVEIKILPIANYYQVEVVVRNRVWADEEWGENRKWKWVDVRLKGRGISVVNCN